MKYPVVLYHGVNSVEHPYTDENDSEIEWVIPVEVFSRHMEILKELDFQVLTFSQIRDADSLGIKLRKPIVLTFDDGHDTDYYNVLPILSKHNYKAEIFVTTDRIGTVGYLTPDQLIEMHKAGMSIQSHAETHKFLPSLSDDELRDELQTSKKVLSDITGNNVSFISYPGGRFDDRVERYAASAGYKGTITTIRGHNNVLSSMFGLLRVGITRDITDDEFKAKIGNYMVYSLKQRIKKTTVNIIRSIVGEKKFQRIQDIRH